MSSTKTYGRLGNQFFINVAASLLAEKHNLYIQYENYDSVNVLFPLFIGTNKYTETVIVNDSNFVDIYNKESIDFNILIEHCYLQSKWVTDLTHLYVQSKMPLIEKRNPYNHNNNCFIHVRLGDVAWFNPGAAYYEKILSTLSVNKIYLSTDSKEHPIVQKLLQNPKIELYETSVINTILFASTIRHLILSHGTFSGTIAYLGVHSDVYFIKETPETSWDYFNGNGMFDIFKDKTTKRGPFKEMDKVLLLCESQV